MANKGKTLKALAKIRPLYIVAKAVLPLFQSQGSLVAKLEWLRVPRRKMGLLSVHLGSHSLSLPPTPTTQAKELCSL